MAAYETCSAGNEDFTESRHFYPFSP